MKTYYECKSFRLFNKIIRKYSKRFWRRYDRPTFFCPWVSYKITTPEQIAHIKTTKHYKESHNLRIIIKELEDFYHKEITFDTGDTGALLGIEITNEDYYYIYAVLGDNNKPIIKYQSCVGGFDHESIR